MDLYYDDIVIKKRLLINGGALSVGDTGITVIQGDNGCGKTLLLKNIFSNEKNADKSMIFIDQNNESVLTMVNTLQNISMTKDIVINEKIRGWLKESGYEYLIEHPTSKLSGGEKRLVNLLRGILSCDKILLIDEPTNDLDNIMVNKIRQLFLELSLHKQLIIITHDDRLFLDGSITYKIANKNLVGIFVGQTGEKMFALSGDTFITNITTITRDRDRKFLNKVFSFNFISILFAMAFFVVSVFQIIIYIENTETASLEHMRQNQVNIYSSTSCMDIAKISKTTFPVLIVDYLYEENPFIQLQKYKEIEKVFSHNRYNEVNTYNLRTMDSTEAFTVYPFEFFDPINRKTYFTIDKYLQKYYNTTWDFVVVDTTDLFDSPYIYPQIVDNPPTYKLESAKFLECANQMKEEITSTGNQLIVASVVIVINSGYTCEDFYKSAVFSDVKNNPYNLISSDDIINCIQDISQFSNITRRLVILGSFLLAFILFDSLFLVLVLKISRNKIFIIKNYAYTQEDVLLSATRKINNRYPKLLILFLFIIVNVVMCRKIAFSGINLLFSILMTLFFALDFWAANKIIVIVVKKYFNWSAR